MKLAIRISVLVLTLLPIAALASPLSAAQILALVKATPQLKIDRNAAPSPAYDVKKHPYVDIAGAPEGQAIGGYLVGEQATQGTLTSGLQVVAIPLDSGGSGGVFTQIVFARRGSAPFAFAGHIDSAGHLGIKIQSGAIVARLPYYGPKDPNCCPSKFIVQTYAVRGGKLFRTSQRMVPAPKS